MRFFKVVSAVLATFAFVLPAQAQGQLQGKRIALLTSPIQNPYIGAMNAAFIRVAEAEGVKVTNLTSPYDAAIQSQQVDDAIGQKFDIIAIQAVNHIAIVPALERAAKAKMPVVMLIAPLAPGNERLYITAVGNDQHELGRIAANELIKAMGGKGGKVAIIEGTPTQNIVQMRTQSFKETVAKQKGIQVVATESANWRTDAAENIARQLFVRFAGQGGLQAVYAMSDNMAFGVIQAAEASGLAPGKNLVVVSSTCQKEGISNIRSGKQHSAVDQVPMREGEAGARVVLRVLKGEKVQKAEIIPARAVTKGNVDEYAKACAF
jgi:ribose transport system substrate-binding protein